jgi:hypothetical protein
VRLPEPDTPVLAQAGKRWVIAQWIPERFKEDVQGWDAAHAEGADYDEATDTYYWPEGWYEQSHEHDQEADWWRMSSQVTQWRELPAPAIESGSGHDWSCHGELAPEGLLIEAQMRNSLETCLTRRVRDSVVLPWSSVGRWRPAPALPQEGGEALR